MNLQETIAVCICTYRRPRLLRKLLNEISRQHKNDSLKLAIVVVDNDQDQSAKETVAQFTDHSGIQTLYCVEPVSNIALARNRAVALASADYLAFIDDDEVPSEGWLKKLLATCQRFNVSGVLGPVEPQFEGTPPKWVGRGGFYKRPRHETGFEMSWHEARTGNVLIRRDVLRDLSPVFRPEFGAGGEDQDLFRRLIERNHRFVWCDEACVWEIIPPHRWKLRFLLTRALLRGKMSLRHPRHRIRSIGKSILAVPLYIVALPVLLILGYHLFVKYFGTPV